jgi:hypothetical protein
MIPDLQALISELTGEIPEEDWEIAQEFRIETRSSCQTHVIAPDYCLNQTSKPCYGEKRRKLKRKQEFCLGMKKSRLGSEETLQLTMSSWEETVKKLGDCFYEAKTASNKMPGARDWIQVCPCMHIMLEIEDLIQTSSQAKNWIYDPELLAQRFQEELKLLNKHWAMTFAPQVQRWLRPLPIP